MNIYNAFYADGRFQHTNGPTQSTVISPSTQTPCAYVTLCEERDVDTALVSAQKGYETWRKSSLDDRITVLERLKIELEKRRDRIVKSLAEEMGCPVWLGQLMQVPMPLKGINLAIEGIRDITWTERIGNGVVERVPIGVVAAITPWNFPLHQIVSKVAAAIAAGCAVVLKPSELAPGAAQAFVEAIHATELPAGVVNVVYGGPSIGEYLVTHPLVNHISFTGSTGIGQRIMACAATRLTPLTLELGGKSAAIVLDDADLDHAIPSIVKLGLVNSGQACVSQSRIIVPLSRRDAIIERIVTSVKDWPVGDPFSPDSRLGPVASQAQYDHIHRLLDSATQQGAHRVGGEHKTPDVGYYVAPTLFTHVTAGMDIAKQEVFGPVIALMTYESEAEAIALANATDYGLSGAVWSADKERATRFAQDMRTGQVVINGAAQNLATPFGGRGSSGFGRENGRFGIEDLLTYRSLHGA